MSELDLTAIQRVRVSGTSPQIDALLRQLLLEPRRIVQEGEQITMDIAVERGDLKLIEQLGIKIVLLIDTANPKSSAQIGTDNRFKDGQVPEGLGELRRKA